jgi:hypothetical protein
MTDKRIYRYESLGDTLDFAESLGWEEPTDGDETRVDYVDGLEENAIEFIQAKGFVVVMDDD